MLECIVQQNNIASDGLQLLDAPATVRIHRHFDALSEFALNLPWFVANLLHGRLAIRAYKPFALSPVATAENRHPKAVREKSDEVFHMGSLPRAADRNIAHTDDGQSELPRSKPSLVVQPVSHPHSEAVKPA